MMDNQTLIKRLSIFLPLMFPLLSIIGAWSMNTVGNNSVSTFLLLLIPGYVLLVSYYHHLIPKRAYPLAVIMISVSLLFMYTLRSNHIMGYDIMYEYFVFQLTKEGSYWDISAYNDPLNTVLSVTVLPTIFSNVLNVNDEFIYKIIYQIIFSFVPLGLYLLYKNYMKESTAFLAAFFFMSNFAFSLQMPSVVRQEIALLFFVLSMLLIFNKRIGPVKRRLLFVIFGTALVVSHYLSAYLFVMLLLITGLPLFFFRKHKASSVKVSSITVTSAVLFFMVTFFWYGQVTEAAATNALSLLSETIKHLQEFLNIESRYAAVATAIGLSEVSTIPALIGQVTGFITKFFITMGILSLLVKFKRFRRDYVLLSLISFSLLVVNVVTPQLSIYLAINRAYLFFLVLLAPSCITGGLIILRRLIPHPIYSKSFLSFMLVVYFLSQTFFLAHLFGQGIITLDDAGYHYDNVYVHDQEIWGAKWLSKVNPEEVYADVYGKLRLAGYGMIPQTRLLRAGITPASHTYFYLRYLNVVNGEIVPFAGLGVTPRKVSVAEFSTTFPQCMYYINHSNLIYNNGGTQVHKWVGYELGTQINITRGA